MRIKEVLRKGNSTKVLVLNSITRPEIIFDKFNTVGQWSLDNRNNIIEYQLPRNFYLYSKVLSYIPALL